MEMLSKLRWIAFALLGVLALTIIIWGMSILVGNLTNEPGDTTGPTLEISPVANADVVRYTIDGPVIASSEHRSFTIEVSRSVVLMRVYADYGQTVLAEKSYKNNDLAYDNLLESLETQGASKRNRGTDVEDDYAEQGACSAGSRFIVEIGDDVRRWTTNCKDVDGTAAGNMRSIRLLFTRQVPDYKELTKGVNIL